MRYSSFKIQELPPEGQSPQQGQPQNPMGGAPQNTMVMLYNQSASSRPKMMRPYRARPKVGANGRRRNARAKAKKAYLREQQGQSQISEPLDAQPAAPQGRQEPDKQ